MILMQGIMIERERGRARAKYSSLKNMAHIFIRDYLFEFLKTLSMHLEHVFPTGRDVHHYVQHVDYYY